MNLVWHMKRAMSEPVSPVLHNATASVEFNVHVAPNQNLLNLTDLDAVPLPCLIAGLGLAHEKYAI